MKKNNLSRKQIYALLLLLFLGCTAIGISGTYKKEEIVTEIPVAIQAQTIESTRLVVEATRAPETVPETTEAQEEVPEPNVVRLNLAYVFPEAADETNPLNSVAGDIFQTLMQKDEAWMSNLYDLSDTSPEQMASRLSKSRSSVMGLYNSGDERHDPGNSDTWTVNSYKKVHMQFTDGDGKTSTGYSNVIPIMSMTSVYTWFDDMEDKDAFLDYALNLWNHSHSYSVSMGDVYYCSGCSGDDGEELEREELLAEDALERAAAVAGVLTGFEMPEAVAETEALAVEETADTAPETAAVHESPARNPGPGVPASPSNTEETMAEIKVTGETVACPGHVDLYINAKVISTEEKRNLFTIDSIGNHKQNIREDGWEGWNTYTESYATRLSKQDWFELYGLSVSALSVRNPLTESEIEAYMNELPADLSESKREMIRFALSSVGKVPYYWGGKANTSNYSGNQFGILTGPDENGRILRGLDCSGWVSWVYWSATGKRLPYESTSGLAACGTRVKRSELEPGDIIIRTGTNAHVIMFLGWTDDGKVKCIHETSGSINNVTVTEREANWPYYRRLLD